MRFFLTFSLIMVSNFCQAQYTIGAKVIDSKSNQPLIGANILLLTNVDYGSSTDMDGAFEMTLADEITNGKLLISYVGYEEAVFPFVKGQTLPDIPLNQDAAIIDAVEVIGRRKIADEFVVQSISKLEVYQNPNSRADPVRAIASLGASTNADETANLSLRGSPPSETGIIFNDVPIEDAFRLDQANGVGQFSIFNTAIIEEVNVYPSNPPLESGAASSGLVSMYSDDLNGAEAKTINLTLAGIGASISENISSKDHLVAYANLSTDIGLKALNPNSFNNLSDFNSGDVGFYWVSNFSERSKLKVFSYGLLERYKYNLNLPSFQGQFVQNKDRNINIINYEKRYFNNSSLELNHGNGISKADYGFGNVMHNIQQADVFQSVNYSKYNDHINFKIGVAWDLHVLNNSGRYPIYGHAYDVDHPSSDYTNRQWVHIPEIYAYNKWQVFEKLAIGTGYRQHISVEDSIPSYLSRQFNLYYQFNAAHQLNFGTGRYNKVFVPNANFTEVTHVSSKHLSLDYKFRKDDFSIQAAVYRKKTNYLDINADINGAELFLAYQGDKLNYSLSLAHIDSKNITEEGFRYPTQHDFKYYVKAIGKYKIGPLFELSAIYQFREGTYYIPVIDNTYHSLTDTYIPSYANLEQGNRLPDYHLLDLSINYIHALGNGSMIYFVSASNILNIENKAGILYDKEYSKAGYTSFNQRVIFFGMVYSWN